MNPALARFLVPGTDPDVAAAYAALAERAQDAVWGFEDETVFLDLETTGFDPAREEIIEAALIVARGPEVLQRFTTLVDPGRPIPAETSALTGIDDDAVAGAPCIESVIGQLRELVGTRPIVAHNACFDRRFLEHAAGPSAFPGPWLDSLQLARVALPRLRSHRLRDLAEAFELPGAVHRAEADTEALFGLWRITLVGLADLGPKVLRRLAGLAPTFDWPATTVFRHLADAHAERGSVDVIALRRERVHRERPQALNDADEIGLTCPSTAEVLADFAPDGAVGRMYPGYETREEQARMAEAVLGAFGDGRHLAVEAGTGVGKSVAYLLPAARYALANGIGVGVATKTNTLMDQLIHRELPALSEALGGELRYTSLKGYDHYLCARKLQRALDAGAEDEERAAALAMLVGWVAQSGWGDLDAINLHWPPALRPALSCSVAECAKKRCRNYPHLCYLHGVRRRADSAHILVTNHALLFRDITAEGGILPPLRHWVVDEAHAAEAEARDQLTVGASHAELSALLRGLHVRGRGGWLDAAAAKLATSLPEEESAPGRAAIARMRSAVETASTLTDSFFDFVKDLAGDDPGSYDRTERRITAPMREAGPWGTVAGVGRKLGQRLEQVVREGRGLVTYLEELGERFDELRADLAGQLSALFGQMDGLVAVLDGTDEGFVYSLTANRRRDVTEERVTAARLDVGERLAEELYPRARSVVFTSATIAAGDDFSHFARAVGLDRLLEGEWSSLRLASSYDFERQMAVFVPTDMCEPNEREYLARLEDLLERVHVAMGGSVLTLFTNRREMEAVYHALVDRLEARGLRLLVQSPGVSRKRIADEFVADRAVSLFATKSFWEGFDARGDTLRCVVVPKLPFGQVRDPVLEERKERDRAWWEHYYLPEAIIELKQAAGRLIRSATDTGCLVLADARLCSPRGYARRFLDALPVRDVEQLPSDQVVAEIERRFGRE